MKIKLSSAVCFPSDTRLYVTAEISRKPVCGCHFFFLSPILTTIGENLEFHWLTENQYKHNDNYQVHLITFISVILIDLRKDICT